MPMVDKLKNSLEQLEPPVCPGCGQPMSWYSSFLLEYSPVVIEHRFSCTRCGTKARREDVRTDRSVEPPGKLSKGRIDRAA